MPRKANPMVGTQLLVPAALRDRARALAIVRGESVADVWREALTEGGLAGMEKSSARDLDTLMDAFTKMGVEGKSEALEKMINARANLADLFTKEGNFRARFPW